MIADGLIGLSIWGLLGKVLIIVTIGLSVFCTYQYATIKYQKVKIENLESELRKAESGLEFMRGLESNLFDQKEFLDKHSKTIMGLCQKLLEREEITDEDVRGLMKKEKSRE
jgi:hypothetical protein